MYEVEEGLDEVSGTRSVEQADIYNKSMRSTDCCAIESKTPTFENVLGGTYVTMQNASDGTSRSYLVFSRVLRYSTRLAM